MDTDTRRSRDRNRTSPLQHRALTTALLYAGLAALWILLSDAGSAWLLDAPINTTAVNVTKGWLFVAVTSLLLYLFLRRHARLEQDADRPLPKAHPLRWPLMLFLASIVAMTGSSILHAVESAKEEQSARLLAIATLKTRQIADWLSERTGDAEVVRIDPYIAEAYRQWRVDGDEAAGERLKTHLEAWGRHEGFHTVTLLDSDGRRLWSGADASAELAAPAREAARAAADDLQVHRVGPYLDAAGLRYLDFVVPLTAVAAPVPVVVLHADPTRWLGETLQSWPVSSPSGETLLFRREGGEVLFLNELRHRSGTALKLRLPVTEETLLAAQAARDDSRLGRYLEGVDYRGIPSTGVVLPVSGTDWYLVAKVDRAEFNGEIFGHTLWTVLVGFMATVVAIVATFLAQQRQAVATAIREREAEAERLRAMGLVATVTDGLEDSVYAKDLQGRYLLCNRTAQRTVGKPAEEVLGRDDSALFPPDQAGRIMAADRRLIENGRTETLEETLATSHGERVFLTTKGPLRGAQGEIIGVFGISRDITGQKSAEEALRESEERLQLFAEHAPVALAMFDREGRTLAASRRWTVDHGLDGLGLDSPAAPAPDLPGRWASAHRRALGGEVVKSQDESQAGGGGVTRHLRWEMWPWRTSAGAIAGAVLFVEDISGRRQAEDALRRQADELQARNEELERFNRAVVDRELDMIDLKQLVNELSQELGREPPFALDFLLQDTPADKRSKG